MSLLRARATAAWRGLATRPYVAEHVTDMEGEAHASLVTGSLALAESFPDGLTRAWQRDDKFDQKPEDIDHRFLSCIGALLPVAISRRPQDHNGITDDVVTVMSLANDSSDPMQCGAIVAGYLAALLDGWDMEAARYQSLFIARRAGTFGTTRDGADTFADKLEAAYSLYEKVRNDRREFATPVRVGLPGDEHSHLDVVAHAVAFTYTFWDDSAVMHDIGATTDNPDIGADTILGSMRPGALFLGIVRMLFGAFRPNHRVFLEAGAVSAEWDRKDHPMDSTIVPFVDQLTSIRYARW